MNTRTDLFSDIYFSFIVKMQKLQCLQSLPEESFFSLVFQVARGLRINIKNENNLCEKNREITNFSTKMNESSGLLQNISFSDLSRIH